MSPAAVASRLEALGGTRWTKGPEDRVYFDRDTIAKIGGMRVQRYRSGGISGATLRGSKIGNSAANDIIYAMPKTAYYDLVRGTLVAREGNLRGATSQAWQAAVAAAVARR
jgi:hypothetical protein